MLSSFYPLQEPDSCDDCQHVKDGPYCIERCPETKYADENNVCQACHPNCEDGCTGPLNTVGPGGCDSCGLVLLFSENSNISQCLSPTDGCADGYYKKLLGAPYKGAKQVIN